MEQEARRRSVLRGISRVLIVGAFSFGATLLIIWLWAGALPK